MTTANDVFDWLRSCKQCGKPHKCREIGDKRISWADPVDKHPYQSRMNHAKVDELETEYAAQGQDEMTLIQDAIDAAALEVARTFNIDALRGNTTDHEIAEIAINAYEATLVEAGLVIIERGSVPEWMVEHTHDRHTPDGDYMSPFYPKDLTTEAAEKNGYERIPLYRINSPEQQS